MSASPTQPANSAKRPLEETSSPTRSNDQPDAKRPALDKILKNDDEVVMAEKPDDDAVETAKPSPPPEEKTNGAKDESADPPADEPKPVPAAVPSVATPDVSNPATHDETAWIHIRAVISSPEAATIIGKGGENVSNIRKLSGAKCTVSDYQKGAVERILTVSGVVDAAAKVRFRLFIMHRLPFPLTDEPSTGIRSHHPHSQQRASERGVERAVQDVPSQAPHSSHPDRLHHRQGWLSHPRDPGGVGRTSECLRFVPAHVH